MENQIEEPIKKNPTEDEFYKKYELITNHIDDNASWDGCAFETYGEELEYVKSMIDTNRVWTVVETDNNWWIIAGYHHVNRLNYLITTEPWGDINEEYEVEDSGCSDEDWDEETCENNEI